jgi:NADH-quinone oxidoreductase subunit E
VQINKDYYEDLTAESFEQILVKLREGRKVKPGPQDGRHSSEPAGGPTTLIAQGLYAEAPVAREGEATGAATSEREAAEPKPPLRDNSSRKRK